MKSKVFFKEALKRCFISVMRGGGSNKLISKMALVHMGKKKKKRKKIANEQGKD